MFEYKMPRWSWHFLDHVLLRLGKHHECVLLNYLCSVLSRKYYYYLRFAGFHFSSC